MKPDDEICLCYHVSLRKLVNFARRVRPRHASQMTECLGAGTGCGWCIPQLCRIAEAGERAADLHFEMIPDQYAAERRAYHRDERQRNRFDPPPPAEPA